MKIDREILRNTLRMKGFNEVWIEEIDEAVMIKQLLDEFKKEHNLPPDTSHNKEMYCD